MLEISREEDTAPVLWGSECNSAVSVAKERAGGVGGEGWRRIASCTGVWHSIVEIQTLSRGCSAHLWRQKPVRGWGRLGEGSDTPLQSSCLENPMDGGAWRAAVHGVAKSQTWLSDFPFTFHFHALEKEMATHSSVLAWRIPGAGEPGGLPSLGSRRVGHDWSDFAAAAPVEMRLLFGPHHRK